MKIIVIDHQASRKANVEAALRQYGIVLTTQSVDNKLNNLDLLSQADVAILIEPNNTDKMAIETSGKHLVIMTTRPFDDSHIVLQADVGINEDDLMTEIVKRITRCRYQEIYPKLNDKSMIEVLKIAKKAAKSSASVLIQGETGTGKEILAKYIHYNSHYCEGPFVAINCAAMPETMIEAILFGYEKGAFTSAVTSHIGKFEQAHSGTIFLDEIGEMSLALQAKLLRVLQEREIERIGGKDLIKINIRVIAATNKNLLNEVEKGNFRQDLYYRLNVMPLSCVLLRHRQADIIPLAEFFIQLYCQAMGKFVTSISTVAKMKLLNHSWSGNIRELDNAIHRALILDEDGVIDLDDLTLLTEDVQHDYSHLNQDMGLRGREAQAIVKMLKETNGSRTVTAKRLKISPRTLRYKISKLKQIGMDVP